MYVPREHLVPRRSNPWFQDDGYGYQPAYEDLRSARATPLRGYPHSYPYGFANERDGDEDEDLRFDADEEVDHNHPHHPHAKKHRKARMEHPKPPQQSQQRPHPQQEQQKQPQQPPQHISSKKGVQIPVSSGGVRRAPQQVVQKVIDQDASAKRIQRLFRAWVVRKQRILEKLRLLKKIEEEVDLLRQHNVDLLASIIPADSPFVGDVPRPVAALEHELTTKLISLDEISVHGPSDIVRRSRKALVNKIEGILSGLDRIKQTVKRERIEQALRAMEVDKKTPIEEKQTKCEEEGIAESTEDETQDKQLSQTEEQPIVNLQDQQHKDAMKEEPLLTSQQEQEQEDDDMLDYAQTRLQPTQKEQDTTMMTKEIPKEITNAKKSSPPPIRQIPSLKRMCYNVCDQVMRRALM